jgi:acyl-CoA reductase-like NAD-dependent aldehyde dehydrogenase
MSIRCISPVNNELYAERPLATDKAIQHTFQQARSAQRDWATRPIAERTVVVTKAVDALLAMSDAIAPELSWQMGRPIRYGSANAQSSPRPGLHFWISNPKL